MAPSTQHYWIVSIPTENSSRGDVFQSLKSRIASSNRDYAEVSTFPIPAFKIGTLDSLVSQSEELAKIDAQFEGTVLKVVDVMKGVLQGDDDKVREQCVVNDRPVDSYLTSFSWSTTRYRTTLSIPELSSTLTKEMTSLDIDLRTKYSQYQQAKGNLLTIQRKQTGNLSTRSLEGLVHKDDLVLESEYMETLLVAVPINDQKDWLKQYETLAPMVVPRSSSKVAEDDDFALYNVTVFKKYSHQFSQKCREHKFVPREYKYDENALENSQKEQKQLGEQEKKLWGETLRLARTSYSDAVTAWAHLKALRTFVESVLRYGLPPDFVSVIIKPYHKQEKKAKKELDSAYSYLGGPAFSEKKSKSRKADDDDAAIGALEVEYSPYVFYSMVV
ncbi:vacuolar ATP synthase subunit C [Saitoella complicata NRRL Y-17804]|nr:vacuolar ATP synthase subunit C [Saitoella complicata NRRL Y-17804]ODQ50453.1 vacuolar ATP synthase subunit C [Saitoella complicata NRRL Y-17804]